MSSEFRPETLFSVPVWCRQMVAHREIKTAIMDMLPDLPEHGQDRSNQGGWHSATNLHLDSRFLEIARTVGAVARECAVSLGVDLTTHQLAFTEMWLNRNQKGDANRAHVHPNSFLSGVYYVSLPPDSGSIEFYDPVRERAMQALPQGDGSFANRSMVRYGCEEGHLLIFPSWLLHGVGPSQSDEERISLAFNVSLVPGESSR